MHVQFVSDKQSHSPFSFENEHARTFEKSLETNEDDFDVVQSCSYFIADCPTAWSVGWSGDPEELKATLRTTKGLQKVHRQFYHLSAKEMNRFILPLFEKSEHAALKKHIESVCKTCKICSKFLKLAPKPSGQTKGLYANSVNDIVCADTFFVDGIAIMHFMDLFSGWSLLITEGQTATRPELVEKAFYQWISIFAGAPRVFFSDQGGEFINKKIEELLPAHRVKCMQSPVQSPFTNPVERHNGIAKTYIKKIKDAHPEAPLELICQESQIVKNLTTRKCGYSAQYLAFAHPDKDATTLTSGIDDLYIPGESVADNVRERVEVRSTARRVVADLAVMRRLQAALTKGMQGTVTGPLTQGQKVEFWAIPDSKAKSGHWLGPCTVIGPGGSGSSNKTWVIRRPNGQLTDAHRHRIRVIEPLDHVQVPAVGPAEVAPPPDAPAPGAVSPAPAVSPAENVQNSENPNLDQHFPIVDFAAAPREVETSASAETKLFNLLCKLAFSDGVTDNWEKPSAQLTTKVCQVYGTQFPALLRVAFTRSPKRLRRLPRDIPRGKFGKRLTLAWDSKRNLKFSLWDSVSDAGTELRAKMPNGLAEGCTMLFEYERRLDDSSDDEPGVSAPPPAPPDAAPSPPLVSSPAEQSPDAQENSADDELAEQPLAEQSPGASPGSPASALPVETVETDPLSPAAPVGHSPESPSVASPVVESSPVAGSTPAPTSNAVESPAAGSTPAPQTSGTEHFSIFTPRPPTPDASPSTEQNSSASPSPSPQPSPQLDNLETLAREAAKLERGVLRSGARFRAQSEGQPNRTGASARTLSFNHRGPSFDHANYAKQVEHLHSAFFTFFADSDTLPTSSWLDSPTLITNQQFTDLLVDQKVPLFEVAKQPCSACFSDSVEPSVEDFADCVYNASPTPVPSPAKTKRIQEIPKAQARLRPEFILAMESEIEDLLSNGAEFGIPPNDTWVFSTRWVYTLKPPPDNRAKARLVVRGFEEKWLLDEFGELPVADSPTLQRDSVRVICHTAAQHSWRLEAWDIRNAFQQCDTRFDPEAPVDEHLWFRLPDPFPEKFKIPKGSALRVSSNHTHQGMASAPRRFYFFLRGIFQEFGFSVSIYDECLFLLEDKKSGVLHGMCGFHVDDGLMCGDKLFWDTLEKIALRVKFGRRLHTSITFCGIRITQLSDGTIELDQEEAIDLITPIDIAAGRKDDDTITPAEVTEFRSRLGSILYVTGCTRPFESYCVSHLSAFTTAGTVSHLRQLNVVIKHLKATKHFRLRYVKLHGPLVCYSFGDSNFKKERDSGSQTGSLTLCGTCPDTTGKIYFNLLRWSSRRTRRIVHSTLAAETLASTFSLDVNAGTRGRLRELKSIVDGVVLTDCNSLWDGIYSMTAKIDEMITPDFYQIRESCIPWRHALSPDFDSQSIEFWWVPTYLMLADNLTKVRTPSSHSFFRALSENQFVLSDFKRPRQANRSLDAFWLNLAAYFYSTNLEPT